MSKMGRPRALDEGKRREICALLSAGASLQRAAQYVGCSPQTVRREAKRDREFRERMGRAKVSLQLGPLQLMRQAAQNNWRAAAWMLERSDPAQFGRRRERSIGAKELRALARDLVEIFNDEIDHPLLRERVATRVRAAVNYALRHAWDTHRSGSQLRQAMEYFDKRSPQRDPWDEMEYALNKLAAEAAELTGDGASSDRRSTAPGTKLAPPASEASAEVVDPQAVDNSGIA